MAIFPNLKSGWQQRDPELRLAAVSEDPEISAIELAGIIRDDPEERVRAAAAGRLDDPALITELLAAGVDGVVGVVLQQQLDRFYCRSLSRDKVPEEWATMVATIRDEVALTAICHGPAPVAVRLAAAARVEEEKNLAAIATGPCGREVGGKVVARINNADILATLVDDANSRNVRRFAAERLAAIAPDSAPGASEEEDLPARAEKLLKPDDWDQAREEMRGLAAAAADLAADKRAEFDRISREFFEKFAVIDKNRREQAEKAAANRHCLAAYEEICAGIEALLETPQPVDEAEYIRLTDRWMSMGEDPAITLAPPAVLERRFRQGRKKWAERKKIAREDEKTMAAWEDELTAIDGISAPARARTRLEALKTTVAASRIRFGNIVAFKADLAALEQRITAAAVRENLDSQSRRDEADSKRQDLCAEIERLSRETPGSKGANRVREIRDQWHGLDRGNNDRAREFEQRYHQALEKFHACHQEFIHEQEWRLWANFTVKERLAREAEALDAAGDTAVVYDCIRALQRQWKEVGAVPRRESERLWQRFHLACERNFERCRPLLAERKEKRRQIRRQHQEFLDRALELCRSDDFAAASAELKKMQAQWKEDGIGVDRQDFRIYKEFRHACNQFFARRHQDFESREKQRKKNLEQKLILCEEAEKLAEEPDWDMSRRFTALQKQWKKIGPVPKSHDPEVWKRFRAACDRYFSWLDQRRKGNQAAKEKIIARTLELVGGDDHTTAAAEVRELQRQWKKIGPVPRDASDNLLQEFKAACNQFFSGLDQEQEKNGQRKLELCYRAEELAAGGVNEKEVAAAMKELQEEWGKIPPAAPDTERDLLQRLKNTCDIFFSGHRERIDELHTERAVNLKRKETLCVRLENLAGTTTEKSLAETDASALAAALQQAMQGNAIASDSGRGRKEEIKKIQQQWRKIGPVDRQQDQLLNRRYRKALDVFYNSEGKNKKAE